MIATEPSLVWGLPFRRLIWLMPAAFALHIVEEFAGGFPSWVTHVVGGSFNNSAFIANNAAFMAIMLVLTAWTVRSASHLAAGLLIFWSSANLFWDGLFHIIATAVYDRYSPGLITSALLYIPISLLVSTAALRDQALSVRALLAAVGLGATLLCFVIWYGLFHFAI